MPYPYPYRPYPYPYCIRIRTVYVSVSVGSLHVSTQTGPMDTIVDICKAVIGPGKRGSYCLQVWAMENVSSATTNGLLSDFECSWNSLQPCYVSFHDLDLHSTDLHCHAAALL